MDNNGIGANENTGWHRADVGIVGTPTDDRSIKLLDEIVRYRVKGEEIVLTSEHTMLLYDLLRAKSTACQEYLVALTQAENDLNDLTHKLDSLLVDTEDMFVHHHPCGIMKLIRDVRGLIKKVWRP